MLKNVNEFAQKRVLIT